MKKLHSVIVLGAVGGMLAAALPAGAQNLSSTGPTGVNQQFFGGPLVGNPRNSPLSLGTLQTARLLSDVEFNDNFDLRRDSLGNALIWTTTLGYGVERRTLTDEVLFDVQGSVRVSDLPEIGTDVLADDPRVLFSFNRQVDDNSLNFNMRYQRADLDYFDPLSDLDPNGRFDDTRSGGTRESFRSTFGMALNSQGPVDLAVTGSLSRLNYFDTVDPDLSDRDRGSVRADVGFAVSPILRLTTGVFYDREFVDNAVDLDRTTRRADVGLDGQINPRMRTQARIGYSEVESRRNTGDKTDSGLVGDLRFIITEKTGQTRLGLSARRDENGLRSDATLGKSVNWSTGQLDADLGLSVSKDTQVRPIGTIRYAYDLPRARISANFRQITTVNDDGEDVINTALGVKYAQAINRVSSMDFGVAGAMTRYEDDQLDSKRRVTLTAQYNHALTRDWTMNAGYRHQFRDSESRDPGRSNAIFLGVRRDWQAAR